MLDRLTEFFFPKQVSTFASDIDNLYFFIFYSSVALFLIVVFGMVYLSIKYRHRKGEELKLTRAAKIIVIYLSLCSLLYL